MTTISKTLIEEIHHLFDQIDINNMSSDEKNELNKMRVKLKEYWDGKHFHFLEKPTINEFIDPLKIQIYFLNNIVNSQRMNTESNYA